MIGRLLLRNFLVNALVEKQPDGQFPTIAGDRWHDSRIVPVELSQMNVEIPVGIVYTKDSAMAAGKPRSGPFFNSLPQMVDVVVEIAVARYEKVDVTDSTKKGKKAQAVQVVIVENDEELIAVLDLFEAQVWRVLHDPMNKWSVCWGQAIRQSISYKSEQEADGEKNNLYALRQITMQVEICPDPVPKTGVTSQPFAILTPKYNPETDLFGLDQGYLGEFLKELLKKEDTSSIVEGLRSTLGQRQDILLPALKRVGIKVVGSPIPQQPDGQVNATMDIALGEDPT